jgi:hypothetical protein
METDKKNYLEQLIEYFPTAVYTGEKLVFVSQNWTVEVVEHTERVFCSLGEDRSTIRVNVYKTPEQGFRQLCNSEDFTLSNCSQLAAQIEKYIENAIGALIREADR